MLGEEHIDGSDAVTHSLIEKVIFEFSTEESKSIFLSERRSPDENIIINIKHEIDGKKLNIPIIMYDDKFFTISTKYRTFVDRIRSAIQFIMCVQTDIDDVLNDDIITIEKEYNVKNNGNYLKSIREIPYIQCKFISGKNGMSVLLELKDSNRTYHLREYFLKINMFRFELHHLKKNFIRHFFSKLNQSQINQIRCQMLNLFAYSNFLSFTEEMFANTGKDIIDIDFN